jgi:hypothetical protein
MEIDTLLINNYIGDWKPTCKDQAHKHIMLHYIPILTQRPLCDCSRTPHDLTPNRITTHCQECTKLLANITKGVLRKCKICGKEARNERDLESFRKDKTMLFERANMCSTCFSKLGHKYSVENRQQIIERIRERRKNNPGYAKNWKSIGKYNAAHIMAQRKIKNLTECSLCHSKNSLVRHHPDYTQPTNIVILCKSCHGKVHSKKIPVNLQVSIDGTAHLVDSDSMEAT